MIVGYHDARHAPHLMAAAAGGGKRWRLLALLLLAGWLAFAASPAGGAGALRGGGAVVEIGEAFPDFRRVDPSRVRWKSYEGTTLDIERAAEEREMFAPLEGSRIDFGYSADQHWLRVPLKNSSDRTAERIALMEARFMHGLEAVLVRENGAVERILSDSNHRQFAARAIPYRHLAARFALGPGEGADLLIGYWSDGSTQLPLAITSELGLAERKAASDIRLAVLLTVGTALIVFALSALAALRWSVRITYTVYVFAMTLYLAHMRGHTFEYLWPAWPEWNAFASLAIGILLSLAGLAFARALLDVPSLPRIFEKLIWWLVGAAGVILVACLLGFSREMKQLAFFHALTSTLLMLAAAAVAWVRGRPGSLPFLLGWSALAVTTVYAALSNAVSGGIGSADPYDAISLGALFEGLCFIAAINAQVRAFRQDRTRALAEKVRIAEDNLALERQRNDALEEAESRRRQLAEASHDVRQPLAALRMALLSKGGAGQLDSRIRPILVHLENLVTDQLSQTKPREKSSADAHFLVAQMVARIDTMFADEARAKGLNWRTRTCEGSCAGDPMAVLRILSNLAANAVRHTERGGVLAYARKRGTLVEFGLVDTGEGLSEDAWALALDPYVKGAGSQGEGLGLSIATALAQEVGTRLRMRSRAGRGTRVFFSLPVAHG